MRNFSFLICALVLFRGCFGFWMLVVVVVVLVLVLAAALEGCCCSVNSSSVRISDKASDRGVLVVDVDGVGSSFSCVADADAYRGMMGD